MPRVTADIAISLDGYGAGPGQTEDAPMGTGFEQAHRWMFDAAEENTAEIEAILGHGAYIMGRNMFGPIRGDWPDDAWKGWWGPEPPYHAPVFVLTHHAREPLEMDGGTVFHFVTGGIEDAFARAVDVVGDDGSISIAGGTDTLRQYLLAGFVDELRLHVAPFVSGAGENLFDGLEDVTLTPTSARATSLVTHLTYDVAGPRSSA
ncbi:dihydrofolate reductase family protein [Gordonia sp. OPL2]|uniref:dihydrofolate reductase family protein n=1 Tax=Gordonia sp. OPL2 TaxID=2486274 RepID=UPI0016556061|nr:dihydrofolate reductase family protein [Gordonia sp. OPL2]ROZ86515.1 dihydrofolate reductase [Gordonia sp. OPL2]